MKLIIAVAFGLVAVAIAVPVQKEQVDITKFFFEQQPEGSYSLDFESADGINRKEEGTLKEVLNEENKLQTVLTVRGKYSYPGEDGKPVEIEFYADESGYHADGPSVPKVASRR